ncbi:hypothetical protein MMC17_004968 [Xylographa soralifera]|nr:hypothetical protein [Xylographa soralifera]
MSPNKSSEAMIGRSNVVNDSITSGENLVVDKDDYVDGVETGNDEADGDFDDDK